MKIYRFIDPKNRFIDPKNRFIDCKNRFAKRFVYRVKNRFAKRFINRVKNRFAERFVNRVKNRFVNRVKNRRAIRACACTIERYACTVHGRKCLLLVCLPKTLGQRRKQLKCSPPSLVAYPRFLLLLPSVYSAHRHRNRVVPLVREESTSIASFARLTTSVDRPAIDTYVHAPFYCAYACAYCSSILYSIHKSFCKSIHKSILYSIHKPFCKSIHKSFCKSIHKSILYSIHKPFCKSILYSIYKSFCKSILAINKTIFGINESVYLLIKIIILFLSHFAFHTELLSVRLLFCLCILIWTETWGAWSRANKARGAAECPRPRPECYIFRNARARTVLLWFIVAAFLASAALNDSKWALRSKLPPTMLARSRGKTSEPL